MTAHDRIRLTGRLRRAPAKAGAFYFDRWTIQRGERSRGGAQARAGRTTRRLAGRGRLNATPHAGGYRPPLGLAKAKSGQEPYAEQMSATSTKTKTASDAYCPHCHLLIEKRAGEEWPKEPLRCPHCRLLVGSGRARPTPSAEPGARGSAAGVFAHEAKRARTGEARLEARGVPGHPRHRGGGGGPSRAAPDGRLPAAHRGRRRHALTQ